jgi:pyruvate/2-oxoacid:ferredoxin oxidoreductase alpha subunit
MAKELLKGNVAIAEAAVRAGLEAYFGYPITPQTELLEHMSKRMPELNRAFVQAESEVAAINMVYGASSCGQRVMTASSGPGLSLMQEGISYLAGAELPCVIVDVVRGGPGLGNIAPEQSDYFAMVKGGGHGNYRNIVLAPASVQEMYDLTILAFELSDRYRNPAIVLTDGFVGQMMESLEIEERDVPIPDKPWAVKGTPESRKNLITSIFLTPEELEAHVRKLEAKYKSAEGEACDETYMVEDAEVLLVGYGIVSRVLRSSVEQLRKFGVKAGLFRPVTLWPFPSQALAHAARRCRFVQVVEMSTGQMIEDVKLAVNGAVPVELYSRVGGSVPQVDEVRDHVLAQLGTLVG